MLTRTRNLWSPLLAAILVSAVAWTSGSSPRPSEAGDKYDTRLLVKCSAAQVEQVIGRLHGLDLELWDMESMRRLPTPVAAPPTPEQVPALADAVEMMTQLLKLVESLNGEADAEPITVTEMSIQERRANLKVEYQKVGSEDRLRAAMEKSPWFKTHVVQVMTGRVMRQKSGEIRTAFTLMRGSTPGDKVRPSGASLDVPIAGVQRAALTARMSMMYASAMRDDPNRKMGYRTVSREFTYDAATVAQFKTLLHGLSKLPSQPTIFELRWKLAGKKDRADQADAIGKSVVRIGVRAPLGTR